MWGIGLLVALCLVLLAPQIVQAHGRSLSYSSWQLAGDHARVRLRITLLELSRLGLQPPAPGIATADSSSAGRSDPLAAYLAGHLLLRSGDAACAIDRGPASQPAETGWAVYEWSLRCPTGDERTIESRLLLAEAPSHMHFARVVRPDREEARESDRGAAGEDASPRPVASLERVLVAASPEWTIHLGSGEAEGSDTMIEASGTSFVGYLTIGVEHILTGWDHLAFLLALVLLASRLGEVAQLVTGFTLAHSLTLALAVTGVVHPRSAPIEAVIGYSVALIALENTWLRTGRRPAPPLALCSATVAMAGLAYAGFGEMNPLTLVGLAIFSACHFGLLAQSTLFTLQRVSLAFVFGLVHGFGFAGVLAEMTLPVDRLVPALLGFNVGVELGQLGVVAMIWPMLIVLRRLRDGRAYGPFVEFASAAVCGLGVFWFVSRALA